MNYRREIDGLRAIAVLLVIFFHAGFDGISGGFVGVDVFFVISGYLITSIILDEKRQNSFSLLKFYERRARRILPALFVVMFACLPFAWWSMNPHQLKEFSQSLVAVALFSSNILFWKQSDYFDALSSLKPLLHTWSLGIEEQYYVIFPLIIIVLWRYGRRAIVGALLMAACASLVFAQITSGTEVATAFYLLPSRAWELALGALAALSAPLLAKICRDLLVRQALSLIGFALIASSALLLTTRTPFPGIYALPATLGTVLIILFASRDTLVGNFLGRQPLVTIGLASYSAYLWHQPILAFLKISNKSTELTPPQYAIYLILTFSLAAASYKIIETPFRKSCRITRNMVFGVSLVCSVFFILLGYAGHQTKGFLDYKLSAVSPERKSILIDVTTERKLAESLIEKHADTLNGSSFGQSGAAMKVVFVGDSMARDLATAAIENSDLFPDHTFRLLGLSNDCLEPAAQLDEICRKNVESIYSSDLLRHSDLVIVSFLWKGDADPLIISRFLSSLQSKNQNILVLGGAGFIDMATVTYDFAKRGAPVTQDALDKAVFTSRRAKFERGNAMVKEISAEHKLRYDDRKNLYCDLVEQRCRIISKDGGAVLWDAAHLTAFGMRETAKLIAEKNWFRKN